MDEITNPVDNRLVDEAQQNLEYIQTYNDSLKTEEPTEQAEQTDEFSDLGDVAREIGSALVGGLQQAGSDIVTLPERAIDMARGEDVGSDEYRPDTDIFGAFENPIETRTWWGGVLKTLVNYGSLAFVPIPGARIRAVQKQQVLLKLDELRL